MRSDIPQDFCPVAYKARHQDLAFMDEHQLRSHWQQYGIHENRVASAIDSRDQLLRECLSGRRRLLEIGPFDRPSLRMFEDPSTTVLYADYLGTDELRKRAEATPGRDPAGVPQISYRLCEGFPQVEEPFDAVVSHHCIEHQPDLIGHLNNVFSILKEDGIYVFTAPHKEHCFDHFIPESSYLEVVVAHIEKRVKPSLRSVIEHRCFTRHDYLGAPDPYLAPCPGMRECIAAAMDEFQRSDYVDVHCWQFTPASIKRVLESIVALGLAPPLDISVFCLGAEFGCVLTKAESAQ